MKNIKIYDPERVCYAGKDVVIACKNGVDAILKRLNVIPDVRTITVMRVEMEPICIDDKGLGDPLLNENCYIVHFSGGLGNQLFQYAFLKNLELLDKASVYANIEGCRRAGVMRFELDRAFSGTGLKYISNEQEKEIIENVNKGIIKGSFVNYHERMDINTQKKAEESLIANDSGVFFGLFQSRYWAEKCKENLLSDLTFKVEKENDLIRMINIIGDDEKSVSIHYRGGDYLTNRNRTIYGNICTEEYYKSAIEYFCDRIDSPHFYIFTDDIASMKKKEFILDATYIDGDMFTNYKDWFDMCLMSKCKHNIIANSTFSWWGAWLNQNPNKTVIAPKRWINTFDYSDIYPEEWLRM